MRPIAETAPRLRRRVLELLLAVGAALAPLALHSQCDSPARQLIAEYKYDEARAALQTRLTVAADNDSAMECIGRVLLELGESGHAVYWLEKAVKGNGKSAQHHFWLGNALGAEGEKAGALRRPFIARRFKTELEQALTLDPTLVDARRGLVMFYSLAPGFMGGSMSKAREQAVQIMNLNPTRGHLAYATLAEHDKNFALAEKELLAAVALMPDSDASYNAAAAFYRRRGRWTESIAKYEKVLRVMPQGGSARNRSITHYFLGFDYLQCGLRDEAKVEYQAAIAANPKNEDAKNALASLQ